MERILVKRTTVITLLVLVVVSTYFLPVKLPYNIETPVKIQAIREWTLTTDRAGFLSASMQDNSAGTTNSYFMTELVRGDAMALDIAANIQPGSMVSAGDTITTLSSSDLERELISLERELAGQKALLRAAEAGEKQPLISEAQNRLAHASEMLTEQERVVSRLNELQKNGYVPYQEYETAQSVAELYRIEVEIAKAELQSVLTGVRQEEIDVIFESINSVEKEIAIVESKLASFTITSPMNGIVMQTLAPDTLVWLADISEYIVVIPVRLDVERDVRENMKVSLIVPGTGKTVEAVITKVGNVAAHTMREQVVIATAAITDPDPPVYHGELVNCKIHSDPLTIREYFVRFTGPLF